MSAPGLPLPQRSLSSKPQAVFHLLPTSAGQSAKKSWEGARFLFTPLLTRLRDRSRQLMHTQGALHSSVCWQCPLQGPAGTLVSLPPDWSTATPSSCRLLANPTRCKRHQTVFLGSSLPCAGADLQSPAWPQPRAVSLHCPPLAVRSSGMVSANFNK